MGRAVPLPSSAPDLAGKQMPIALGLSAPIRAVEGTLRNTRFRPPSAGTDREAGQVQGIAWFRDREVIRVSHGLPNLGWQVPGNIHRRQRLVAHRRTTRRSKSLRTTVFVDAPSAGLPTIEQLPAHAHAVTVLTVVFRVTTRNDAGILPREFLGGHHFVRMPNASGESSAEFM